MKTQRFDWAKVGDSKTKMDGRLNKKLTAEEALKQIAAALRGIDVEDMTKAERKILVVVANFTNRK